MLERLGIFEECQRRRELYGNQNETLRRRIVGGGPAKNGAKAQAVNPFQPKPRAPIATKLPFWQLHSHTRVRRRIHGLRADLDVNPMQIVQAVCEIAGLTSVELMSRDRTWRISHPRQAAQYFIARYSDLSLSQIAAVFRQDHTSVMHALRAVPMRIDEADERTRTLVDRVEARLRDTA